jgi:CubicO group peptidase (beta-lactamase class C family)
MKRACVLVFLSLISIGASAQQSSFVKDSIDTYIRQGMKDWNIPGLAVVIVKDGQVAYMTGFGVKDIQSNSPVDENTLFFIASNTKLFTGMALANLDFRGKLSLNDKIIKYFPGFKLYEKSTTDLVTIRDMLSHRIGTKTFQGDFTFWNSSLSRREIINRMKLLKPVGQYRQEYGYCNSCFLTAGEVIPVVTKQPWEVYVYDSIVIPVGMKNTHLLSNHITQLQNVASPYTNIYTGTLKKIPYDQWDNMAPAASIVSNVNDLSKWLLFQLDSGRVNGQQVIPWNVLQETRKMNTIVGNRGGGPTHFVGYGLGVFMKDYVGKMVYYHGGGAAGMISNVTFVPEEKLGIAILTNNDNHGFLGALQTQILDAYLNVPYENRSKQALTGFQADMKKQLDEIAGWEARTKAAKPVTDLKVYAGEYNHELYGKLTINVKDGKLYLRFGSHSNLTATMEYMDNDEWLLKYDNVEYGIFSTKFNMEKGKPVSVIIKANPFVEQDAYTFIKKK